ncbi:MAG: B12-binding domain-containing radical SAM protein, partial [Ilumatobacteraceae bacterium]
MSTLWARIEPLLARVQKPARYIGCEDGAIIPRYEHDDGGSVVAWLLAYPDTYEIGLPNQGLQILFEILNEREDAVAERAYAPWPDLEALMRADGVPLFSVDTHRSAADFDVLAFNLSSELVYTNLLNMVDLAGVPVRSSARTDDDPIVVVGGHSAFNPEPIADFVDAVVLGEGEEVVAEITDLVLDWKRSGRTDRASFLRRLSTTPGVYVPSMYEVSYDGPRIAAITPRFPDVPLTVDKRTVADLGEWPYPKHPIVPLTEVVHDRL